MLSLILTQMCLSLAVMFLHRQPFSPIFSLFLQVRFWRSNDRALFSAMLPFLLVGAKGSRYIEKPKCTKEEAANFVV